MEKTEEYSYDLRNIFTQSELEEMGQKDFRRVLNYRTYTNGYTKILSFDDNVVVEEENYTENHTPELMVNIELEGLGISLITDGNINHINERREVLFCSLNGIQGILIDFKTERKIQLRITQMQIDNQFAVETNYPVTLFSHNIKKAKNKDASDMKPFFNLNIVYARDIPDVIYFKKIEFLIQKIIILVDDELMMNIVYFSNTVMDTLNTSFTGVNEIFVEYIENEEETINHSITGNTNKNDKTKISQHLINKVPDWKTEDLVNSEYQMYIKQYNSSPLDLKISFYSTMKVEGDKGFNNFLRRFGLALNTIEGAPIKLNALEMRDVVGNLNDIMYILKDQYMSRLKKNLFRVLGASSLIGNPIQLVNNVSSGFKDFFYKPVEGFVEGPLEGGKGLAKGTKSLFTHTVQGTFSSASGIFGSLSKGALVLANDKDYIREKEKNAHKERPKNVLEGVGFGIKSAAKSFGSGITGVVKMPIKGAKKKGIGGFFTGALKGATGLIAKPVAGAMDFVSKTSEGIKNHATSEEDMMFNEERLRLPRVFYAKERVYKTFDVLHAFAFSYLVKRKKCSMSDPFVDASIVSKNPIQVLVL